MANRKKVLVFRRDGWKDDYKLALTEDQINLLDWLLNVGLINSDDWDTQVLEEAEKWMEI